MVGTTMRMQTQYNSYKQLRVMTYRMPPLCEYRNAHHNTDMIMQRHVRLKPGSNWRETDNIKHKAQNKNTTLKSKENMCNTDLTKTGVELESSQKANSSCIL